MNSRQQAAGGAMGPAAAHTRVLVLGLGNPILGDDGVGWRIEAEVQERLRDQPAAADVDSVALGGLSLMERMLGYDRVILIDAMQTGMKPEGTVTVLTLSGLSDPGSGHTGSAHDTSLKTALQTAEFMGEAVPSRVEIVAIEAKRLLDFSEELSPAIAAAVPIATQKVLELLSEAASS